MTIAPKYTICIDPGLRCSGLAVFLSGLLVSTAAVENPHPGRGPEAWRAMASAVVAHLALDPAVPKELVVEKMVHYPGSPVRTDDLMELVGVSGAVVGALDPCSAYFTYTPKEWKGSVPKPVHNKRTMARLTPAESELFASIPRGLVNNAIDAAGIGLFRLKRKSPG